MGSGRSRRASIPREAALVARGDDAEPAARKELFRAVGADPVGELRGRALLDVPLHLVPAPLVVADALARGADGEEALQRLQLSHCVFDPGRKLLLPRLDLAEAQ